MTPFLLHPSSRDSRVHHAKKSTIVILKQINPFFNRGCNLNKNDNAHVMIRDLLSYMCTVFSPGGGGGAFKKKKKIKKQNMKNYFF